MKDTWLTRSTQIYSPLCPSMHPSVGWCLFCIFFLMFLQSLASLLPPTCSNTSPMQTQAIGEAVYPTLFLLTHVQQLCREKRKRIKSLKSTPIDDLVLVDWNFWTTLPSGRKKNLLLHSALYPPLNSTKLENWWLKWNSSYFHKALQISIKLFKFPQSCSNFHKALQISKKPLTSTPGVQRCVHMRLSLLRIVEWCNNLRYFQDSMHFHHSQLDHHGPTDQPTNRPTDGRTKPLIEMRGRI